MWTLVIGLALLAVATIAGFLHLQRRAELQAEQAQTWPTATGRVVQNMLVNTYGRFAPVIAYTYSVDGRDYRRSRVRFGNYTNLTGRRRRGLRAAIRSTGRWPSVMTRNGQASRSSNWDLQGGPQVRGLGHRRAASAARGDLRDLGRSHGSQLKEVAGRVSAT